MGHLEECVGSSCDRGREEAQSAASYDKNGNGTSPSDAAQLDPLIAQIYTDFDLAVSTLRRKMGKELEQLQAMQHQLFAEQVKEREVKERLALLHLERDALLIDLSELRAKRNGVSAANEERAAVFQTIHRSLERVVNRAGTGSRKHN